MDEIAKLKEILEEYKIVVVGAGAGLSTSAGFTYTGERFEKYFSDFGRKYGFTDMYSGGFYPYSSYEEFWAYWSRYIMINRYIDAPEPVYEKLLQLLENKDYFVITTNVDHCFQKAGFDKARLYYMQGDYGLFQCSEPCHQETYDNEPEIRLMWEAQGADILSHSERSEESEIFRLAQDDGDVSAIPQHDKPLMKIPTALIPHCPRCGKPMSMNLRSDNTFVQDAGWYEAAKRYQDFLVSRNAAKEGKVLFLELGVGGNTPGIIKYPFWRMTTLNKNAMYVCINFGEAVVPPEIAGRSLCINADIGEVIKLLEAGCKAGQE